MNRSKAGATTPALPFLLLMRTAIRGKLNYKYWARFLVRHGRAWLGHPRLTVPSSAKAWVPEPILADTAKDRVGDTVASHIVGRPVITIHYFIATDCV